MAPGLGRKNFAKNIMNEKTLKEIDFFRIRDEVAGYCVSQEGKQSLLERLPLIDKAKIEMLKNMSREWVTCFSVSNGAKGSILSGWEPVNNLISIIKTSGAALSIEQVWAIGQFIISVNNLRKYIEIHSDDLELKIFPKEIQKIPNLSDAESRIFRVITNDGQLRDLPEITAIRKQIASLNSKIKNIMQKFTSDQKLVGVLESTVPVLRGNRQVLAVKSNMQNRIPGIIHEVSQSQQTVYIEPDEAVLCSNELIQKEYELQAVIKRILTELTFALQPSIPAIRDGLPVMCLFDTTQAAARWGVEHNCTYALSCGGGANAEPPALFQARHPLLGDKAVPIDIRFMDGKKVLIITGPNTGGKTVTLKTFALLSMLNQTGLPIPADEGSRLPVFSNFYADIGDDQSLDQSLSTFSGHMKNIAEAVSNGKSDTLILLDELGSGTDPQEGTAISMAVLDELIRRQSFVLVTTHQGVLKNYGYTNPSCVNASVEFDQNTLSPSYRLLMGVPGESHALDIAQKNGLPAAICKAARNYIATEQTDVSALIRGLNRKHIELNKVQREAQRISKEYQEKYDRLKAKELELRRKENELKKGKQQELNDFLIHSRRQLENLVRTLKEGEVTHEKTVGMKKFLSDLADDTERLEDKIDAEDDKITRDEEAFEKELKKQKLNHPGSNKKTKKKLSNAEALKYASATIVEDDGSGASTGASSGRGSGAGSSKADARGRAKNGVTVLEKLTFKPGAYVTAGSNRNEGVLLEETRKGVWQVQFGSVMMTVKQKDLKLIRKNDQLVPSVSVDLAGEVITTGSADYGNLITEKIVEKPAFELRLLGMHAEEAIKALEHQIDLCALNNFPNFSVIHGKGNGVLMQVVQDYLSNNPMVQSFEQAPAEDGGAGKTYVTLKS